MSALPPRITTLVLAAGLSTRMGRFKPLLPLGGRTALELVIGCHRRAGIMDIRVVAGHRADEVRPVAENAGARVLENPAFREGMFSSVLCGLRSLRPETEAFFVHPVDVPLVRPETLSRLKSAWDEGRDLIIHPVFRGRRGHPPLISRQLLGTLLAWTGEGGLKRVLEPFKSETIGVEVPDEFILLDMDVPQDYQRLAAKKSAGSSKKKR
ncbi:MAG: nucleotidyltransferase family protein [Thermodesulfobacteriota bacterium]